MNTSKKNMQPDLKRNIKKRIFNISLFIVVTLLYFPLVSKDCEANVETDYIKIDITTGHKWDSGKTSMSNCTQGSTCSNFDYNGILLDRGTTYYWRIKYWDDTDQEGSWSTEDSSFSLKEGCPETSGTISYDCSYLNNLGTDSTSGKTIAGVQELSTNTNTSSLQIGSGATLTISSGQSVVVGSLDLSGDSGSIAIIDGGEIKLGGVVGYEDKDGDGHAGSSELITSSEDIINQNDVLSYSDCDDNNPEVWQNLTGYTDNDNDGYGTGTAQALCTDGSLPSGYADNADDIDDNNDCADNSTTHQCGAGDLDGTCTPVSAGENGLAACQRCNGTSIDPVNITDDTQDTEGSNLCNQECKKCSGGSCVNQTDGEDIFSQCGSLTCDGSGSCKTCYATGQTCSESGQCCSGYCADGYCCNEDCNGNCDFCNKPGNEGTCVLDDSVCTESDFYCLTPCRRKKDSTNTCESYGWCGVVYDWISSGHYCSNGNEVVGACDTSYHCNGDQACQYTCTGDYNACEQDYNCSTCQYACVPGEGCVPDACDGVTSLTYDGQTYNTIQIGNQCWLNENLNVDPNNADNPNCSGNKYCPEFETTNCDDYGGLYDWNTMMCGATQSNANPSGVQGLCPDGWHLPSDSEWWEIEDLFNDDVNCRETRNSGHDEACEPLAAQLSGRQDLWDLTDYFGNPRNCIPCDDPAFEESGLDLVPAGTCNSSCSSLSDFSSFGAYISMWSTTERDSNYIHGRRISINSLSTNRYGMYKPYKRSVRCIKD